MSFIVIEGLDGSGKSSQLELLIDYYKNRGINVEYLHFPTTKSEIFGDLIARFLSGDFGSIDNVNPYLVSLLFAGDRYNLSDTINKWMQEGKTVITDRYVFSNIAFQCAKLKSLEEKEKLADWIFKLEYEYFKIPKPDLSIFLNVPFDFVKNNLSRRRIENNREYLAGKDDIHEIDFDFQEEVYKMYKYSVNKYTNFISIDCFDSNNLIMDVNKISEKIISNINKLITKT